MHVVIFSEHFHKDPSGPRMATLELAREFVRKGTHVSIVSLSPRNATEEISSVGPAVMHRYNWKLIPVRQGRHRFCARILWQIHKRSHIDAVLAMGVWVGTGAAHFRQRSGVPFVFNPRSRIAYKPGDWRFDMTKKLVAECDAFVGLSESEVEGWCRQLELPRDGRFFAVHNGFNPSVLEGEIEPLPGVPRVVPMILCMANLRIAKGQHRLMHALDSMDDLPWFAVLAGGGTKEGRAWVVRHHERMRLKQRVLLPGVVTGARWRWLYRNAALFCMTPVYPEAFGNAFLEAQAAGLPVITSDGGGHTEAVAPGETALIVPRGDAMDTELQNALRRMLTDAALRERMGAAGRQRAQSFTWDQAAEGYLRAINYARNNRGA